MAGNSSIRVGCHLHRTASARWKGGSLTRQRLGIQASAGTVHATVAEADQGHTDWSHQFWPETTQARSRSAVWKRHRIMKLQVGARRHRKARPAMDVAPSPIRTLFI